MNRKNIPLVMMLVTGAVVSVITYIRNCTVQEKLAALLITLVIFWILGSILEGTLNRFDAQNEERRLSRRKRRMRKVGLTRGQRRTKPHRMNSKGVL